MSNKQSSSIVKIGDNVEIDLLKQTIQIHKELTSIEDELVLSFSKILEKASVSYVVVAEYVAILFGRARRSDDVDFIVGNMSIEKFLEVCRIARNHEFYLIQGDIDDEESIKSIYEDYLNKGFGIRFLLKDIIVPNIEFKFANTRFELYSLKNCYKVIINGRGSTYISPIELQIAYKLALGSEKDVGDAIFLYMLLRPVIKEEVLEHWAQELNVDLKLLKQ
ncbi:MAG: hypothetical protein ACP5KW_04665 [Thermoproteota archaeon]